MKRDYYFIGPIVIVCLTIRLLLKLDGSTKTHSSKTHSPKHLTTATMPPKPLSPKSRLRRLKELDKERKLLEAIEISR